METIYRDVRLSTEVVDGSQAVWVELTLSVDENLKPGKHLFGDIQIESVYTNNPEKIFWDGLEFFINGKKKELKEECEDELVEKGLYVKGTFKAIKALLKEAKKLGILTQKIK